jgi:2,3-dimethylmalate lyase
VEGLDAALERGRRCAEAGADVLFVEAPETEDEVERIASAFPDTPLLFNAVDGGRTPLLGLDRLRELGFAIVLRPVAALFAATRAVQEQLATGAATDLSVDAFADLLDRGASGSGSSAATPAARPAPPPG